MAGSAKCALFLESAQGPTPQRIEFLAFVLDRGKLLVAWPRHDDKRGLRVYAAHPHGILRLAPVKVHAMQANSDVEVNQSLGHVGSCVPAL